jgi:hypothetical protein
LRKNYEKYIKFIKNPGEENILFWVWFKNNFDKSEYQKYFENFEDFDY